LKKVIVFLSFFALCLPAICLAHPGHGNTGGYTITHYFTEPVHLITTLIIFTGTYVFMRYLNKNIHQKVNS
jgi:hypothetical protein